MLLLLPLQVLFTPQTPLAAPGPTLLEQILYPQPLLPSTDADLPLLQQLLRQVKLEHLLQRAQGLWTMPMDWTGTCTVPYDICMTSS